MSLTHMSLFSGIGGIDLAAEWAGFETVGQVEWADYPTKVLEKHWPDVPRWRDIRDVTGESFRERTGLATVDIISGGFPCQPFSVAGQRNGADDDRYLWPEMLRVINEIKPSWVIAENVTGIISMEQSDTRVVMEGDSTICKEVEMVLETIRRGLKDIGYDSQPITIPAVAVGAKHRRERIFILAYADSVRRMEHERLTKTVQPSRDEGIQRVKSKQSIMSESIHGCSNVSDADRDVVQGSKTTGCDGENRPQSDDEFSTRRGGIYVGWRKWSGDRYQQDIWITEPDVGRMAHGVPARVDRLKCLGNAVVPQQVYPLLYEIAQIERRS